MMDNQDFDQWMKQELEQYQFSEASVLPQMEAVLDKLESLRERPNWWQKHWKGGMFGGIVIGALIALSTYYSQEPLTFNAYKSADTLSITHVSPAKKVIIAEPIVAEMIPVRVPKLSESPQSAFDLQFLSDHALGERLAPAIELPKAPQMAISTISLRKLKPLILEPIPLAVEISVPQFRATYSRLWLKKMRTRSGTRFQKKQRRYSAFKSNGSTNNRAINRQNQMRNMPNRRSASGRKR